MSETEGQEPKKRGFFSRIFGGGGDSDQHKSLTKMDSLAAYVIREHRRGRRLDDILQDHYVQNRLSPQQQARLIDRQDLIQAVSTDDLDAARQYLSRITT